MPNKPTLKAYIKTLDDKELNSLFEYIIAEMNRRKAKEQSVDVGFWNSDGLYIKDIQKIDESDEWADLDTKTVNNLTKADLMVWFDSQSGEPIPEYNKDEFLRKVQDIALNYGMDFSMCSDIQGMYKKLKELDKNGFFDEEQEIIGE